MEIDKVVTLKNGKKYLILLESELYEDGYFLANVLDEDERPTNDYAILQDIEKEGRHFVKKVDDPMILNELLADYMSQYEDMMEEENKN